VRVGHLVEHHDDPLPGDLIELWGGQGGGLDRNALMDGVGAGDAVDGLRQHDLGLDRSRAQCIRKALQRVAGGPQAMHAPLGVAQHRFDRVEAVEDFSFGGLGAAGEHF
jgi:hypothetical protein